MSNLHFQILILEGYHLTEKELKVSPEEALEILTSEKQLEYTCVKRNKDDLFTFQQTELFCNACHKTTPAYRHIIDNEFRPLKLFYDDAQVWVSQCASFFDKDNDEDVIELYEPISGSECIVCPHCGKESFRFNGNFTSLLVQYKNGVVSLTGAYDENNCLIKNKKITKFKEPMDPITWNKPVFKDYLYETIKFDLNKGEVKILYKQNEKLMYEKKIGGFELSSITLDSLIDEKVSVRATLKRFFNEYLEETNSLCLEDRIDEISASDFILYTHFVGYNKHFYEHLRMLLKEDCLKELLLNDFAKKMHEQKNNIELYNTLKLPAHEHIKNFILNNPAYFFFYKTINKVFKQTDAKSLLTFLNNEESFPLLCLYVVAEKMYKQRCKKYGENPHMKKVIMKRILNNTNKF